MILRAHMVRKGIDSASVAHAMGIKPSHISQILSGAVPITKTRIDDLVRLLQLDARSAKTLTLVGWLCHTPDLVADAYERMDKTTGATIKAAIQQARAEITSTKHPGKSSGV